MRALDFAVKQGKALYAGISNYPAAETKKAAEILRNMGTPCLIHQPRYSMLDRWVEPELLDVLEQEGMGCIAFSPLAQGLLTNRYLKGIPEDSRAAKPHGFLTQEQITPDVLNKIQRLNKLAELRNQSLAQMAIAWLLKDKRITSVLVGASSSEQLRNSLQSLSNLNFSEDELKSIDIILND
jgi:L-glyceraldehyde 3-phosphate reductase